MNHTLFSWCKFDKCAEFFDAYYFTGENLAFFVICYDGLDIVNRFIHHLLICSADRNCSVICDIDFYTGLIDDRINGFSSLTYHIADLFRIDLDLNDLRCVFIHMLSRACDTFFHNFSQNILSCLFGLCNSLFNDRTGQTMDLDIHLDRCDTIMCTCHLEIHIAEEILQTLDIGQNDIIIIGLAGYQTTGDTCYRFFDRYTCCHQRHGRCTDTCLRSRSVGFECLRYGTDRIWEFFLTWQYRNQSFLSQCAMTDLTTSRSTARFCLTYRVGREVIVMHVTFSNLELIQAIQTLSLGQRSQGGDGTDLCLSSCKHGRTVNTRYDIRFCSQRTDLCDRTTIRTFVIFQDHLTNGLFLILVHGFTQNSQPFLIISKCFFQFCCHLTDIFFSCLFVIGEYSYFHLFRCYDLFHRCEQFFRNRTGFIAVFCFSAVSYDFVDKCDDLFVDLISFKNSFNHLCFRNFVCSGFNHDDFFSCGSNSQFQVRFCILLQCRVNDQFTIDHTYLCCCTRSVKRNI